MYCLAHFYCKICFQISKYLLLRNKIWRFCERVVNLHFKLWRRARLWLELFASTVDRFLSRVSYLPSYVFLWRRRSFTSRKLYALSSEIPMFLLHYLIELMFLELDVWVFITPLIVLVPQDSNATIYAQACWLCCVLYMPLFGLAQAIAKVCFVMGKHASQWMEQTEANLSYNLLVTLHFLWELLLRTICHRRYSDRACDDSRFWYSRSHVSVAHLFFPLNFNPLHFNHRFNWPTVYSSGSLSNLEPGTTSSSVKTVKDGSEPLAIHTFPLQPLQNWCMFVWLTTGV